MSAAAKDAIRVAEIFTAAGATFNKLGELIKHLQQTSDSRKSKWREEEIEMLRIAIKRFGQDLQLITEVIKRRSVSRLKKSLKKAALEEAKINVPFRQLKPVQCPQPQQGMMENSSYVNVFNTPESNEINLTVQQLTLIQSPQPQQGMMGSSPEVTLNMLNAPEFEVEGDGLHEEVKLDFAGATEEVTP